MFTHKVNKLPKNTVEIEVDIKWDQIKGEFETAFERLRGTAEIEGFRKGKAPREIAEKHIKREDIYQEAIRMLFPQIYQEIVQKEALKPIISPKLELIQAKEGEDWKVKFITAEKPKVELGDYKAKIKKFKAEQKKDEIWVPGKDKAEDKQTEQKKQRFLNEVLNALIKESKCEIPDLIVEDELNRKLTQIVDDVQKIGLTIESYLTSKGLTLEGLKAQFKREIEDTYKIEFILMEVADRENITVDPKELDQIFASIKDEKERQRVQENSYFYASILRKQKTLDFLMEL